MSQYQNGTVSVTNSSNVVTGSGTAWLANINSGDLFTKAGDNVAYTVASVASDTNLTLTANYGGTTSSGSNYGITISFTSDGLPLLSPQDLNTSAIYNEAMKSISNTGIGNLGTAAFKDVTASATDTTADRVVSNNYFQPSISYGLGTQRLARNETGLSTGADQIIDGSDLGNTYFTDTGAIAVFGTLTGTWKVTQGFGVSNNFHQLVTRIS